MIRETELMRHTLTPRAQRAYVFFLMGELDARKYWIGLNMVPGVGAITYRKLLNAFHDPQKVFSASPASFRSIPGLAEKTIANILQFDVERAVQQEFDAITSHGAHIITWNDDEYPDALKNIFDPPPILYVKGQRMHAHDVMVAIVGSRQSSTYGRTVAEQLAKQFALKGVSVVSGMARGIDSAAHRGAIRAGGQTIAVLGCGVDVVYPPEHSDLYQEIIEKGTLLSELPMATKPDRRNFPARNRIISGLSLATVVVEAGEQSGALITADMALEQGRDVFAVPGNITSGSSKGTNRLIKQGAALIEHADDVLNAISSEIRRELQQETQPELPLLASSPKSSVPPLPLALTPLEEKILELIPTEPIHIDEIAMQTQTASGTVSATLMMLEMKNLIRQLAGKMFVRQ